MSKFTQKEFLWYPTLVRIKRSKKEIQQACDLYISKKCVTRGWNLRESKWYNPECPNDTEEYTEYLESNKDLLDDLYELVGQELGCWCSGKKGKSCHGTILIEKVKPLIDEYLSEFRKQERSLESSHKTHKTQKDKKDKLQAVTLDVIPYKRIKLCKKNSQSFSNDKRVYKLKIVEKKTTPPTILEDTIVWNKETKSWDLPQDVKLGEDMCVPREIGIISWFGGEKWIIPKGTKLTGDGRIDARSLFNMLPHTNNNENLNNEAKGIPDLTNKEVVKRYLHTVDKLPKITKSAITDLRLTKRKAKSHNPKNPFVCQVKERLKKGDRYMLRLYDGVGMYKVPVGSQLYELIKEKFIDKEDYIRVVHYASTKMSSTRNLLVVYHFEKIVVKSKNKRSSKTKVLPSKSKTKKK